MPEDVMEIVRDEDNLVVRENIKRYHITAVQPKPYLRPLPFYMTKRKLTAHHLKWYYPSGEFLGGVLATRLPTLTAFTSKEQAAIRQEAENKLQQGIAEIRVNALDLFRTRKEAIDMVTERIGKLITAMRALRRANWRQFKKALGLNKRLKKPQSFGKDRSGNWLEYSYGWAPLYSDIYTILNETLEPPSAIIRKRIKRTAVMERKGRKWVVGNTYENEHTIATSTMKITQQIKVELDVPQLAALQQYGVLNPAAVAWEAIPFSFVVDWFYPVGDFLGQLNYSAGLKLSNWNVTETMTTLNEHKIVREGSNRPGVATAVVLEHGKKRSLPPGKPAYVPQLSDTPLTSSIQRTLNAISLFGVLALDKKKG